MYRTCNYIDEFHRSDAAQAWNSAMVAGRPHRAVRQDCVDGRAAQNHALVTGSVVR